MKERCIVVFRESMNHHQRTVDLLNNSYLNWSQPRIKMLMQIHVKEDKYWSLEVSTQVNYQKQQWINNKLSKGKDNFLNCQVW